MPNVPYGDEVYGILNKYMPGFGNQAKEAIGHLTHPAWAADRDFNRSGYDPKIRDFAKYYYTAEDRANAPDRESPYNAVTANQNRAAQLALLQQMQSRIAGDSIAGTQGAQALAQNARQALGAMGQGALGSRLVANQMAGVGGGLAGDIGRARAQEVLGGLTGGFGAAGQLRSGDLSVMGDQAQAALKQRQLDDAARMFFAAQGSALDLAQLQSNFEAAKLRRRLELMNEKAQMDALRGGAETGATFIKLGMG